MGLPSALGKQKKISSDRKHAPETQEIEIEIKNDSPKKEANVAIIGARKPQRNSNLAARHQETKSHNKTSILKPEALSAVSVNFTTSESASPVSSLAVLDVSDEATPKSVVFGHIPENIQENIPNRKIFRMKAHEKSVTAMAINNNASRLLTGGKEGELKLWEFGCMTSHPEPRVMIIPVEGHAVKGLSFFPTTSSFICAGGDKMCRWYGAFGEEEGRTIKGDMYVRDMNHTKGHTHTVTSCQTHPFKNNQFITSSLDATVRIWDTSSRLHGVEQGLPHLHCLKAIDKRNLNITKCAVNSAAYDPNNASFIVGGCSDGSLQLWNDRKAFGKPDAIVREAHKESVCFVHVADSGTSFVSRGLDHSIRIWDVRNFKKPLVEISGIATNFEESTVAISPEGGVLAATVQSYGMNRDQNRSELRLYDYQSGNLLGKHQESGDEEFLNLLWPQDLDQIIVGTKQGHLDFVFDEEMSTGGVVQFYQKTNTKKEPQFAAQMQSFSIYELPEGYVESAEGVIRKMSLREKNQNREKRPQRPSGREGGMKASAYLLKQMMTSGPFGNIKDQDSSEVLRSYEDKTKNDPVFVSKAYTETQPKQIFNFDPINEEQEALDAATKCPRCGVKLCHCGYLQMQQSIKGEPSKVRKIF
eukprot:GHVP01001803.1.p1 GENE.GHVP01001803.1~~GHVP01001803.1.p1  ORF type:complete len:675 (+),score=139.12 GHVP01001803.1:99-2027(+)